MPQNPFSQSKEFLTSKIQSGINKATYLTQHSKGFRMKTPKFFISSTIYDFADIRSSIKYYLEQQGYTVLASEFNDFPKPLDLHSYDACFEALKSADYFILLIGSRVGGWYDKENSISITQQEYREAYKLHMEGKLKLLIFIRSSLWDVKEDRKSLARLLTKIDIDDREKDVIINHESKFFNNAQFIMNFISEVCRLPDINSGDVSNQNRPTGNWVHPFHTFSDIAQAIEAQIFLAPPHEAITRQLLTNDLSVMLSEGLLKLKGKLFSPIAALNKVANELEYPNLEDDYWHIREKHWNTLALLAIQSTLTKFSRPSALYRAIESGLFLEYDIGKNTYIETTTHSHLCSLRNELELFNLGKDKGSLKIAFTKFNHTVMKFKTLDVVAFLHTLDRWSNIIEISICIINDIKHNFYSPPNLRPQNPIPSMLAEMEAEKISVEDIELLLARYRSSD